MSTIDFSIRPWEMSDLPALIRHADNPRIAANMTDAFPSPFVEEKARAFLEAACSHETRRLFAIVVNGEAAGGIGLHPQQDIQRYNAELGYWLSEMYWGKGIMPEAIKQVVKKGFAELDLVRIFAKPFGSNKASQRVLEKAGFELEAVIKNGFCKNGRFVDELIYAVRKNGFPAL